ELLGQTDENAFRPADIAEPIDVLVVDNIIDHRRAEPAEPRERVIDVVDSEHDTQVAQRVHGRGTMVGCDGRHIKARQLDSAVPVRCRHHGDFDALTAQTGDTSGPLAFDGHAAFQGQAEFSKEFYSRIEVLDHDANVVHSRYCH